MNASLRGLDADEIVRTAGTLRRRIGERFPGSGLERVATEVAATAERASALGRWLSAPVWWVRAAALLGTVGGFVVLALSVLLVGRKFQSEFSTLAEFVQGIESSINDVVLLGIGAWFLLTMENRLKRSRALRSLHVLRSLAHIVDMHQLTKDPERVAGREADTASSPERTLTAFELTRYLDYCSELLALLSKLAALHVQNFNDPVTLEAVNDVENLAQGLSRTIWQKIVILDRFRLVRGQDGAAADGA